MTLWLVGGIDPTGGAGLVRDRATARAIAPELAIAQVVTAHTVQGAGRPATAEPVEPSALRRALAELPLPVAIKVGLVPDPCVPTVIEAIDGQGVPIVIDPVMRASDGGDLGATPAGLLPLCRIATLLTPNLIEADALAEALGCTDTSVETLARALAVAGVLVKGGHADDSERVCDELVWRGDLRTFARDRVAGADPRGTGCALATAIACELARGVELPIAVTRAIAWLDVERTRARPGPDGRAHLPDG